MGYPSEVCRNLLAWHRSEQLLGYVPTIGQHALVQDVGTLLELVLLHPTQPYILPGGKGMKVHEEKARRKEDGMTTAHRKVHAAATAEAAIALLAGCGGTAEDDATQSPQSSMTSDSSASSSGTSEAMGGHKTDGGPPPEGIEQASSPTYPVGTKVTLTADHMSGMKGAEATISGAFDTTAYSISYTPTDGGQRITDHKWVVHEELKDPGDAPLEAGTEVVLDADHMAGMDGAEATIDSASDETVYMVDLTMDGMKMTNHKWVVESEIQPAK